MNRVSQGIEKEEAFYSIYKSVSKIHDNLIDSLAWATQYKNRMGIVKEAILKIDKNNKDLHRLATKMVMWGSANASIKHYDFTDEELQTLKTAIETMTILHNDNGGLVNYTGMNSHASLMKNHMNSTEFVQAMIYGIDKLITLSKRD